MSTVATQPVYEWNTLPWKKVEKGVFKLQKRIYRAAGQGDVKAVRRLQKLLTSSRSAKLLATRKVTQDNQGKKTAGVDGVRNIAPKQRMQLAANLKVGQKASPTRRVWIPKPGTEEQRPLGIPTMRDRATQALIKLALEPEWEAKFEPNSYGFRPGRSAHDAIETIYNNVSVKPKYVLDADIAKCFDRINHEALLKKVNTYPTLRRQIKAWLRAGVMDGDKLFPTKEGTPQGGVISPLLANIALHGLETKIVNSFKKRIKVVSANGKKCGMPFSPAVIRYADDFVVLHTDLDVILKSQEIVSEWLSELGLELKPSKTRITHTLDEFKGNVGFDFLGFNIRQYRAGRSKSRKRTGVLCVGQSEKVRAVGFRARTRPSKDAKKRHYKAICEVIDRHRGNPQEALINNLNPIIRGWSNYYSACTRDFGRLDTQLFLKLFAWAKRRHPLKNRHWLANKYWHVDERKRWEFSTNRGLRLFKHRDVKCRKHIKVRANQSPYDGDWVYWSTRLGRSPEIESRVARLLKKQQGKCVWCGLRFKFGDLMEVDHFIPKSVGGRSGYGNLQLLHRHCHDEKHREIYGEGTNDKAQVTEEPCEAKVSSTVLKTNR